MKKATYYYLCKFRDRKRKNWCVGVNKYGKDEHQPDVEIFRKENISEIEALDLMIEMFSSRKKELKGD